MIGGPADGQCVSVDIAEDGDRILPPLCYGPGVTHAHYVPVGHVKPLIEPFTGYEFYVYEPMSDDVGGCGEKT